MSVEASSGTPAARAGLGPFLATMIVAGGMIGSGVYLLPASLAVFGSISILGWLAAVGGAALLAGVFSWLAILRPGGTGLFSYIREALGPGVGFVVGLLYWCPVSLTPIAVAVTGYIAFFAPAVAHGAAATLTTLAVVWLLTGANLIGPRFVARFGGWTLLIGLAPILLVAVGGWFFFKPAVFAASWNVSGQSGWAVVPRSAVIAFWAFLSIENAIIISPLLRRPHRDVPIATFGGLAIASAVYLAACGAIMGLMPAAALARSTAPFADVARPFVGAGIAGVVALCAMLKGGGALGSSLLVVSETAQSDAVLGQVRAAPPRRPGRAARLGILISGAITSLAVIASASPTLARQFTIVADIAVVLCMIAYLAGCLALLRFSAAAPARYRPAIRVVAVAGALFCCVAIAASETDLLFWTGGAIVIATAAWWLVRWRRPSVAAVPTGA